MSSPQGSLFPRLRSCGADGDLEAQFLLKCLEDHGPAVELTPSGAALSAFLLDIIDAVTNSSPGSHELLYLVIELFSLEWSPRMIHPGNLPLPKLKCMINDWSVCFSDVLGVQRCSAFLHFFRID